MSNLPALTNEQMDLIKNTVAKGATDNELKLFLYRCKEIGLDPLKPGQIFFIKYGSGPGTIVIGRDGFRARAASIGLHTGTKVGIIRDEKGDCLGAWCEVYRKDWSQPAREEVSLKEYDTGKGQWQKMPETMIKKVAEVAALRMAFPDQLSGLYSSDEMEQATPTNTAKIPFTTLDQIAKEKGPSLQEALRFDMAEAEEELFNNPGDYIAQCGKTGGPIIGNKIKDIPQNVLMAYLKWLRTPSSQDGPSQSYLSQTMVQEFIAFAEEYINDEKRKNLEGGRL